MLTDPDTTASLCEELSAGTVLDLETYISDPSFSGMFNPDMMGFGVLPVSFRSRACLAT
jgi:hypothetical protein